MSVPMKALVDCSVLPGTCDCGHAQADHKRKCYIEGCECKLFVDAHVKMVPLSEDELAQLEIDAADTTPSPREAHAQRRAELLAEVEAADTVEALRAVVAKLVEGSA